MGHKAFFFYDPPYIERGKDLYLNQYTVNDHKAVAAQIEQVENPCVVTYDYEGAIAHGLYPSFHRISYHLSYSAQKRYGSREVMFVSSRLKLPSTWGVLPFNMAADRSEYPFYGVVETMKEEPPRQPNAEEGPSATERFVKALKTVLTVPKSAVPNPFKKDLPKKKTQ